jgi:hypothetical protein
VVECTVILESTARLLFAGSVPHIACASAPAAAQHALQVHMSCLNTVLSLAAHGFNMGRNGCHNKTPAAAGASVAVCIVV